MTSLLLRCLVGVSAMVLTVGCSGGGIPTGNMSGTVTFRGEPVPYGTIEFHPASEEENPGPTVSTEIRDGVFDTSSSGAGVVKGPLELRITAYPSEPATSEDETVEVEPVEPYFVGYTINMDYSADAVDIVIPDDAEGFDIFSANN